MSPRILVVGAGIVGSAIADRLQSGGADVTLFEADIPGGGATASAMGHLVTLDDSPAQLAFCARGLALWKQEALPPFCEREAAGTLWVASDAEEMDEADAKLARYAAAGIAAERVDAPRLRELEPALRPGLPGGLRVPGDEVIYPVGGARFLLARAQERGARLRRERVLELSAGGVRTETGRHEGDIVLLAAGLGTSGLLPGLPIQPRKGHLAITGRVPGLVHHQLVELGYLKSAHGREATSVAFNVQPRATGQLLIGSSREFAGLDPSPNRALLGTYSLGKRQVDRRTVWRAAREVLGDAVRRPKRTGTPNWYPRRHGVLRRRVHVRGTLSFGSAPRDPCSRRSAGADGPDRRIRNASQTDSRPRRRCRGERSLRCDGEGRYDASPTIARLVRHSTGISGSRPGACHSRGRG